jgi:hypothetical protein
VITVCFIYFDLSQHVSFNHWTLHYAVSWKLCLTVLGNSLHGLCLAIPRIRIELCKTKLIYVVLLKSIITLKKIDDVCVTRFPWSKQYFFLRNRCGRSISLPAARLLAARCYKGGLSWFPQPQQPPLPIHLLPRITYTSPTQHHRLKDRRFRARQCS